MELRVGGTAAVIVNEVEAVMEPETASTLVVPIPTALARPVGLMVSMLVAEEIHVTVVVRSCLELSE